MKSDARQTKLGSIGFKHSPPYDEEQWKLEQSQANDNSPERNARRKYFSDGVNEMRELLEREFMRTHPNGQLHGLSPLSNSNVTQVSEYQKEGKSSSCTYMANSSVTTRESRSRTCHRRNRSSQTRGPRAA